MVKVIEVVQELQAKGFMNSGRTTRGRILKSLSEGAFTCQVDDKIKGVTLQEGPFTHQDQALSAIRAYWDDCNKKLESGGCWM